MPATRLRSSAPQRLLAALAALAASLGCGQNNVGLCSAEADCAAGSRCDTSRSPAVCVVSGGCDPLCTGGAVCVGSTCIPAAQDAGPDAGADAGPDAGADAGADAGPDAGADAGPTCAGPADCPETQTCAPASHTCAPLTGPVGQVTSPADGSAVSSTLPIAVEARGPGGVTQVRLELRRGGSLLGGVEGARTPGSASAWSALLALSSSVADGPASLVAIVQTAASSTETAPVALRLDQTPPSIALLTDGRATSTPAGSAALVRVLVTDVGVGSTGTAARILAAGSASPLATATVDGSGVANFSVLLGDALAPPGVNTTLPFSIAAEDLLGNRRTVAGDPKAVVVVRRALPVATLGPLPGWHRPDEVVQVGGTLSSTAGSFAGGLTGARLLKAAASVGTATVALTADAATTWSGSIDLGQQGLSASEGAWSFSAVLTDEAGNAAQLDGEIDVDPFGPSIEVLTDGRGQLDAPGSTAQVVAQLTDTGTGCVGTTAALTLAGSSTPLATAIVDGAGLATFALPLTSALAPGGQHTTLHLSVTGRDALGNTTVHTGDPRAVVVVGGVQVGGLALSTPPDAAGVFRTAGGPLTLVATVTSTEASVSSACLRLDLESPAGACPHAGTLLSGDASAGVWSFSLPRPGATSTLYDGTRRIGWTVTAEDALSAGLAGDPAAQAPHRASATGTPLAYYNAPPSLFVAVDATWYARAGSLTVHARIADLVVGLDTTSSPPALFDGVATTTAIAQGGSDFSFSLPLTRLAAGTEGPLPFTITAANLFGLSGSASSSRNVDDKAPVLSTFKVFSDVEPAGSSLAYPAAVAGTGWDGTRFVYSDVVHVKGTLADGGAGLLASRARVRIDGFTTADDGTTSSSSGTEIPLGCSTGAACSFDLPLALNDPHNGRFLTGRGAVLNAVPTGTLQLTLLAEDDAQLAAGGPQRHGASTSTLVRVTRLAWSIIVPTLNSVRGLALHPNGDLLVAGTAPNTINDTLVALRTVIPTSTRIAWTFGAQATGALGTRTNIFAEPVIGAGSATSALIYVATCSGRTCGVSNGSSSTVAAVQPDGNLLWSTSALEPIFTAPALVTGTTSTGPIEGVAVATTSSALGGKIRVVYRNASTTSPSSSQSVVAGDDTSSPIVFGGRLWWSSPVSPTLNPPNARLHSQALVSGWLGARFEAPTTTSAARLGSPITDGTSIWAADYSIAAASAKLWRYDALGLAATGTPFPQGISGDLSLDAGGSLWAGSWDAHLYTVAPGASAATSTATASSAPYTPLQGSDGHTYIPQRPSTLQTFAADGSVDWSFTVGTPWIFGDTIMDCNGVLYVAVGSPDGVNGSATQQIYAFVTDDHGLADSPWPSSRRDTRNTANAGALPYGHRTASGCTQ